MNRIIIIGKSRSGTTITQNILNDHYNIQIYNEKQIYSKPPNLKEILNKEKAFYDGISMWFGDKQGMMSPTQFELLLPLNIKFVYIYRDGRDVVSSGIRLGKMRGVNRGWKTPDQRVNSEEWARAFDTWGKVKKILNDNNYCEIRFEDYIDNPGKNGSIIASFLGVNKDEMILSEKKHININKTHSGYYTEWCPNWKDTFHPDAIQLLYTLGYIGD